MFTYPLLENCKQKKLKNRLSFTILKSFDNFVIIAKFCHSLTWSVTGFTMKVRTISSGAEDWHCGNEAWKMSRSNQSCNG